ncbi:MAG: AMP-binding protein [Actinomycetota bacterium]|nr:AMP-binding protein [Candidatus Dormibacteraeota bacterium]MDQ6946578.1 AMP-binding protein [Actinomycetota bacterium]
MPRGDNPFARTGVERGPDGVARYSGLALSLVHAVRASVERVPDAEAVAEVGGERLTYRQLWDRAARVAGGLRAEGIQPGDRVAIRVPAGVDWVLAFLGAQLAGAVAVPVNTRFAEPEIEYVVSDSGSRRVLMPGKALPDGDPVMVDNLRPQDLAAIFYTSGTTGFPKGAMTTHENFLSNVETAVRVIGLAGEDSRSLRTLVSVPLFHVTGCNSQLLVMLALGSATVILPAFEVQAFLRAIQAERINLLVSVPAVYFLAITQPSFPDLDVEQVRWVAYGGAPIATSLVRRIQSAFPQARVGNGFGLTECASIATYLPHQEAAEHADSVGFAAPVVDLALEEPDPQSGVGQLLLRGPNVVAGYWKKPEATRSTFVDGWLRTGDLARVDARGLTYIVDRVKDMINRGGENVYCVEVENALAGAPGVGEASVLGVLDPIMGEKVGAVIVPLPDAQVDVDTIVAYCRERLADFKVPQYLAIRSEPLPRNPGGKVLKSALREQTEWGSPLR